MEALAKNKDYNIVAWVDKNTNRFALQNYKIVGIDDIQGMQYDFIIIAILDCTIAKNSKTNFIRQRNTREKLLAWMQRRYQISFYVRKI